MNVAFLVAPRAWRAVLTAAALSAPCTTPGQDSAAAIPKVYKEGRALRFDFPELRVGTAEYDEGPTGTTVFYFPSGVKGAVDVRGGAPGTLNATTLMDASEEKMVRAVVFSGGSWFGLSAATGVANGIKELDTERGIVDAVPDVVGAIIFDIGGRRYSRITPDDQLGRAALRAATSGSFPLGARGAGRFAMQGVYYVRGTSADRYAEWAHAGQGGAFRAIGPTRVAVFSVVNALGSIVDRNGRVVRCQRNSAARDCPLIAERLKVFAPINSPEERRGGPTGNTTLTLVVTNQKMPFEALQRLAKQVHSSMSRAIQPFATQDDGDVLYAVTTDEVENGSLSPMDLGVIASELAWDAVLSSVPELPAPPALLDAQPASGVLRRFVGTYEFHGGSRLTVMEDAGALSARLEGNGRIYFDAGRAYRLTAAKDGLFIIESAARDVIRFDDVGGRVTGLTLNPGPWGVGARTRR